MHGANKKSSRMMACLAVCAGAFAACSSASSGSGGTTNGGATDGAASACPGKDSVMLSAACIPCLMAHCSAEQSAYAGPDWATESYSAAGGACGAWLQCIPTCACNDSACDSKCAAMMTTTACTSAGTAVDNCTQQYCATDCAASFNASGSGFCVVQNGSGGTCPTAGLIGCCKTATGENCVYAPFTAAIGMQMCSEGDGGGTWSTTL